MLTASHLRIFSTHISLSLFEHYICIQWNFKSESRNRYSRVSWTLQLCGPLDRKGLKVWQCAGPRLALGGPCCKSQCHLILVMLRRRVVIDWLQLSQTGRNFRGYLPNRRQFVLLFFETLRGQCCIAVRYNIAQNSRAAVLPPKWINLAAR